MRPYWIDDGEDRGMASYSHAHAIISCHHIMPSYSRHPEPCVPSCVRAVCAITPLSHHPSAASYTPICLSSIFYTAASYTPIHIHECECVGGGRCVSHHTHSSAYPLSSILPHHTLYTRIHTHLSNDTHSYTLIYPNDTH